MLLNLCVIAVLALIANGIMEKIKLPGLLGMLVVGMVLGPYSLNYIDPLIMEVSTELTSFALIVILLRAGLGLRRKELNEVGKAALLMSFIPGVLEGAMVMLVTRFLLEFSWLEAGILGFIIAAVSPAVVVPQMLELKEKGWGKRKEVPTLVLAGASLDDVFAITIYSVFMSLYFDSGTDMLMMILQVPVSIAIGIFVGVAIAVGLMILYKRLHIRDTKKILILLAFSIVFRHFEEQLWMNALLGIMTIGFVMLEYMPEVANRLSVKMNKVWVFAEIILFVLIGAKVDFTVAWDTGAIGLAIIGVGLIARSIGVSIALAGSGLNYKEKWFCVFSYLPKATVQAAIGAIPLELGVQHGEEILALAVLAILITAPIGAIAIRKSAPRLLDTE